MDLPIVNPVSRAGESAATDAFDDFPGLNIDRCVSRNLRFADLLPVARAASWSLAALMHATGCGDQCGLCRPYLRRMLATEQTTFDTIIGPDSEWSS